jgi:hypothetical protein
MRKGSTYSDIAVYLPTEDAWLAGVMPKEKQFKWAWGYYEMRYVYFPDELSGFNPTWINSEFLEKAIVENGILKVGDAKYKALYLNADYMDYRTVKRITELAAAGLTIILKKDPLQPGAVQRDDYSKLIRQIRNSKNVSYAIPASLTPFITGTSVPRHWCRRDGETIYIFFPDPKADRIKFPLEYGQSLETETRQMQVSVHDKGKSYNLSLTFKPYQSLLYKIEDGKIDNINIDFMPKVPSVKKRPDGYQAPWLIR